MLSSAHAAIVLDILGDGTGPGPATNEIELNNFSTVADITDTQPAGNLRNLFLMTTATVH